MIRFALFGLALALAAGPAPADEARTRLVAAVATAANGFLAALPADKRAAARPPFQGRDRTTWRYPPGSRAGLPSRT